MHTLGDALNRIGISRAEKFFSLLKQVKCYLIAHINYFAEPNQKVEIQSFSYENIQHC